ncbi:hypothetical protein GCM10010361_66510 [Streptomyces olivaceiscleroticus]|uniref:Uncharacterized protein n=1 Tax=Streptomyces olivaceiscleroticus TaxID=68245 RepID=A0ABN1B7V1_9ACTN
MGSATFGSCAVEAGEGPCRGGWATLPLAGEREGPCQGNGESQHPRTAGTPPNGRMRGVHKRIFGDMTG